MELGCTQNGRSESSGTFQSSNSTKTECTNLSQLSSVELSFTDRGNIPLGALEPVEFIFRFPRNQKPRHHSVITCVLHAHAKLVDFQTVMEMLLQNTGMLVTKHLHTPPWSKSALIHFPPEVDVTVLNQPNTKKQTRKRNITQ